MDCEDSSTKPTPVSLKLIELREAEEIPTPIVLVLDLHDLMSSKSFKGHANVETREDP